MPRNLGGSFGGERFLQGEFPRVACALRSRTFPEYRRRSRYMGTLLLRNSPTQDPTVELYLGSYGGPRGVGVSYERGTPVVPRIADDSQDDSLGSRYNPVNFGVTENAGSHN